MITIRNRIIPFGRRFGAINLFGVLFYKRNISLSPRVMNHEEIHSRQMRELLYVPFYVVYLVEWLWRIVEARGDVYAAYRNISFEREAYGNEGDGGYVGRRRRFGMWRG
ncbi:MAG: hypothetical protein HDS41_05745 [Bacteroides sp.]|nr:hypothetical protein [Bacteroides sp.]